MTMEFSQMFEARNLKHPAAEKVKMAFEKTYNMPRGFRKKQRTTTNNNENIEKTYKVGTKPRFLI